MGVALGLMGCDARKATPSATQPSGPGPTELVEQGPTTPGSLNRGVLFHTQFATEISAEGVPVGESDAFPEGTPQILVLVGWQRAAPGTELRVRLFQDDRFVTERTHVVVDAELGGLVVPLQASDGFPTGVYTAELSWNGLPDELATFTVGDVPRPGVLVGEGVDTGPLPYASRPTLLVVTRFDTLRAKLGEATDEVLDAARRIGDLHDLDADGTARSTPEAAVAEVHRLLRSASYSYLLIIGNDDVVPYFHVPNTMTDVDTLTLQGSELPPEWVPSDDPYTDLDGDEYGVPDFAAARIPSSEDRELLLTQLSDLTPPDGRAYALANQIRRSQAASVVAAMSTHVSVLQEFSPPTDAAEFAAGPGPQARYLYLLLHGIGTLTDGWAANLEHWTPADPAQPYAGEWSVDSRTDAELEAVTLANNPGSHGVVNVGACYGAWTLDTARNFQHKTADNNLALHYLKSGTRAFIADTHLSYSVPQDETGLPLGRTGFERVFWRSVGQGMSLIDAFQTAKVEVAASIGPLIAAGRIELANINRKTVHYMVFLGRP
ncbi:MAG TPA: hypothetical protein VM451_09345 [Candidatus Limnocylindria bacterium]|nr:hypothetical protein [Candidatus Limnocylindria bacterium]